MTTMHGKGEESEAVSVPPRGNRGHGINRGPFGSLVKCLAVSRQEVAAPLNWKSLPHADSSSNWQVIAITP